MLIEINDENVEELFEILCEINMETDYYGDFERPAGIDNILDQLCEFDEDEFEEILNEWLDTEIDCDHYFIKEVSDYATNVTFVNNGMIYDKVTIFKCCDCGKFIERVEKNMGWIRKKYDSQPFYMKGLLF